MGITVLNLENFIIINDWNVPWTFKEVRGGASRRKPSAIVKENDGGRNI